MIYKVKKYLLIMSLTLDHIELSCILNNTKKSFKKTVIFTDVLEAYSHHSELLIKRKDLELLCKHLEKDFKNSNHHIIHRLKYVDII